MIRILPTFAALAGAKLPADLLAVADAAQRPQDIVERLKGLARSNDADVMSHVRPLGRLNE
jgi:hypothetical protein